MPGQAQRFAAWLTSQAGARTWARYSGIPAHTGVLSQADEIITEVPAEPDGMPWPSPLLTGRLAEGGSFHLAFPPIITSDLLLQASSAAVQSVVSGEQTSEQALGEAAEKMRQALRQGKVLTNR